VTLLRSRRPFPALAAAAAALTLAACALLPPPVAPAPAALTPASLPALLERHGAAPPVGGNRVALLLNGEEIFPAVLDAIRSAHRTITFAQYAYGRGPMASQVAAALAERCRAGVGAKVLLDAFGSRAIAPELVGGMSRSGCHVVFFRPLGRLESVDVRNHRRILVVDGQVGFTGGAGVGRKWMGNGRVEDHWRDTDVRVEGPAAADLQRAFAENWLEATGRALDGAPPPPAAPRGESVVQVIAGSPGAGRFATYAMFLLAIGAARRSLDITNPYFLPDDAITDALIDASRRGVRVRILGPGPIDYNLVRRLSRGGFGRLLESGVEIYEYGPALLHSKTMVVDGAWATVGSANLDNRSFAINAELNVGVSDAAFAAQLDRAFSDDLRFARKVDYERWSTRGFGQFLIELLAAPFRPLL
jgi:cardiolipin synthase